MSQERKAQIAPQVRAILKRYRIQGSLGVRNHSTLVLTIRSGSIDFIGNFNRTNANRPRPAHLPFRPANNNIDVNVYWYHEHFSGQSRAALKELIEAMNQGNHDRSDSQTDYFDVGWYVDVNIGRWDRPYQLV